jgi:hypothetical protein
MKGNIAKIFQNWTIISAALCVWLAFDSFFRLSSQVRADRQLQPGVVPLLPVQDVGRTSNGRGRRKGGRHIIERIQIIHFSNKIETVKTAIQWKLNKANFEEIFFFHYQNFFAIVKFSFRSFDSHSKKRRRIEMDILLTSFIDASISTLQYRRFNIDASRSSGILRKRLLLLSDVCVWFLNWKWSLIQRNFFQMSKNQYIFKNLAKKASRQPSSFGSIRIFKQQIVTGQYQLLLEKQSFINLDIDDTIYFCNPSMQSIFSERLKLSFLRCINIIVTFHLCFLSLSSAQQICICKWSSLYLLPLTQYQTFLFKDDNFDVCRLA